MEGPAAEQTQKDHLVSAEKLTTIQAAGLKQLAISSGQAELATMVKYDVDIYKMVYLTQYKGQEVRASGLMVVPLNVTTPAPLLSAQHGTIFAHKDAPSNFQLNSLTGFESFGSAGYLTLVPDYLGFGEAKQMLHPYYDQKHSAMAVVDMIKAGKSFFKKNNISVSEQLFLAGYSEGGYVTLAAQKEIEENPAHGLTVTATGAGAGGYDLEGMLRQVVSGQNYNYPGYLAYILSAYNNTNSWNRPLTDFFQEPYASRVSTMFNGTQTGSAINNALSNDPSKLFNPTFLANLRGDGEKVLKAALKQNSLKNWVPKSPTRLYHGTSDTTVPFVNSQETHAAMMANGASFNVTLTPIKDGTHSSSLEPMIKDLIPWMESLKNATAK